MDEQEFKTRAEQALDDLYRRLSAAADDYDFEIDFNAGALSIEFEKPPGKFVVSPNSPVSQIWVSAHSKSFKLDWDPARSAFVLAGTKQSLAELIGDAVGQQLGEKSSSKMAGVYISYPFCAQKCTYCNFASGVFARELEPRYLEAVRTELRNTEWAWIPETMYLGGGTPSLIDPEALRGLLSEIPGEWSEATMEAAPGGITPEKAAAWRRAGINRVSLGVQSFNKRELARTGRKHTAEIVEHEIGVLRAAGISNFNVDLIAGLPGQTLESWNSSLEWVEQLAAPHVSVYMLEVDEDSRLGAELMAFGKRYGAPDIPSDDLIADFYEIAVERLARAGIARYEISNFARPGFESRHNLKYWRREPYLGFGADAHSFDGAWRWQNPETIADYLRGSKPERTSADPAGEHFFLGLRLSKGIEGDWSAFRPAIERLIRDGLLEADETALRLTNRGVLLSNEVFAEFV